MELTISDTQEFKIVYQRWVLVIPVLVIFIGFILLYYDGGASTSISLIGSLLILIGLLTLGALLASILAISLSTKTLLARRAQEHESFREKIEREEALKREGRQNGESEGNTTDL
jgi:hypothetical protein